MRIRRICLLLLFCLGLVACAGKGTDVSESSASEDKQTADTQVTSFNGYYGEEATKKENNKEVDEGLSDEIDEDARGGDVSSNNPSALIDKDEEDSGHSEEYHATRYNYGNTNVSVPTYFEYYDGLYFLVDCYNNQIICSPDIDKPIYEWQIMDNYELNRPHTIAFDGEVYMVDDTDNNRIISYVKKYNYDGTVYFERTQVFTDMGERPHYTQYVPQKEAFFSWSSMSGQMWVFKRSKDDTKVFLDTCYTIPDLKDVYVRSFTIMDGLLYFVSGIHGDCCIYVVDIDTFEVVNKIPVAPEYGGMVQFTKLQDYYYISVSTSLYGETELRDFIRVDSLENINPQNAESLLDYVTTGYAATPYNLTVINGSCYLTLHRDAWGSGVVKFDIANNVLCDKADYFY